MKKNEVIITIPTKLSDINLEKGLALQEYLNIPINKRNIDYKRGLVSFLCNIDIELIKSLTEKSIEDLYNKIDFIHKDSQLNIVNSFKLKGRYFNKVNLDNLTVQEYGDIEFLRQEDPIENLGKIFCICYREILNKKNNSIKNILYNRINWFKRQIYREYSNVEVDNSLDNCYKNEQLFRKYLRFDIVYAFYLEYQQWEQKNYNIYFKIDEEEYENDIELTQEEIDEQEKQKEMQSFASVWGIYHILNQISTSRIEFDYWMKQNVLKLFKELRYRRDLNIFNRNNNINNG